LVVEVGTHALDELKYLAGTDANRLADLNHAIRDPGIRAIVATRGGKGAYRIADGLDFAALAADPKLLIGFSEITILHLAIWKNFFLASTVRLGTTALETNPPPLSSTLPFDPSRLSFVAEPMSQPWR
jgi:muramoyltetrapeptide carboxypeptidase LdcA involved in peptidoglycan recycling